MSQASLTIADGTGEEVLTRLDNAFGALGSWFYGATDPATNSYSIAGMFWADSGNMLLKQRNAANDAWITKGNILANGTICWYADAITNVPAGNIIATTVQAAINELDISGVSKLRTARTINGVSFDGSANIVVNPIAIINDTKTSGTSGGTFTSGAWRTRALNTIVVDQIGITLSSNQITLPAGTYEIAASAPGFSVQYHKVRLYNITNSTAVAIGTTEFSYGTYPTTSRSHVNTVFTLASSAVIELQHYCSSTATDGFGQAASFSVNEVYSTVTIRKVG